VRSKIQHLEVKIMKYRELLATGAIAAAFAMWAPFAMAQSAGVGAGVNAGGAGVGVNAGAGAGSEKSEKSSSMGAAHDEQDPQQEDQEVTQKISEAKSQGKDTASAEKHQKMGERAMNKGNKKSALQHFEQAEQALGGEAGEEHGTKRGANY
jgi:hypothetical protein